MSIYIIDPNAPAESFPPVSEASSMGLLAIGGELTKERVSYAYHHGIFPWYEEDLPPMWYAPPQRFVLFPEQLHVPKSMRPVLRKSQFEITVNKAFSEVITYCADIREITWITEAQIQVFEDLYQAGEAISVEAWQDGELAGGLYGGFVGGSFYGESMFTLAPNASKAAFICLVQNLKKANCLFIDCQVYTDNLARFGAKDIPREQFMQNLALAKISQGQLSSKKLIANWNTSPDFLLAK